MTPGYFSGERLRWAREQLSDHGRPVSQDRFAGMIGVSQRSIVRWERGKPPRADVMPRIAEALGRDIAFFYGGDADEPGVAAAESQMTVLVRELARMVAADVIEEVKRIIDQRLAESWTSGNHARASQGSLTSVGAGHRRPSRSSSSHEPGRSTR